MNVFTQLLKRPASELTAREAQALELYQNSLIASNKGSETHWLRRALQALKIDPARRGRWIVRHETNRRERRKKAKEDKTK